VESNRILYLFAAIAVGGAITYLLRALPFIIFAGKTRKLPVWIEKLDNIISPVIIGGLIIYSYSSLQWQSSAPYAAGALTVALQLWRNNALTSIIAGTALYMALLQI
jgi:branched-subunit amino acid transport protein AzlD